MQLKAPVRLALLIAIFYGQASVADEAQRLRGQMIFELANCYSCHSDVDNDGKPLAGGRELKTSFGVFVTPNITPDVETGIGGWSEQQFIEALSEGLSPAGEHYFPAFPYTAYRSMTRQDMRDLFAYLSSLEPVNQANRPHRLKWFVSKKLMGLWNLINGYLNPPLSTAQQRNRGDYIVNALGHCGECHSPRNSLGMLERSRHLQGNAELDAPNITPSGKNGIADWSDDELTEFFRDGLYPDGDYVGGHMTDVIDNSSQKWSDNDLNAVIRYLRSLP
jgi:mono/diheme cytochrome c family protein